MEAAWKPALVEVLELELVERLVEVVEAGRDVAVDARGVVVVVAPVPGTTALVEELAPSGKGKSVSNNNNIEFGRKRTSCGLSLVSSEFAASRSLGVSSTGEFVGAVGTDACGGSL
jgi:hypothetical protein